MNKSDLEKMQKCQEEYEKYLKESPLHSAIDEIAKDIRDRQDNAMAMEFTIKIGKMLRENGVVPHITEHKSEMEFTENSSKYSVEQKYGVLFDSLDFTEHDRKFTDKIAELEKDLDRKQTEINQIYDILNRIFGVTHDIVKTPDEFEKILKEKSDNNKNLSDFIPEEPIKVADMLINAQGEYKREAIGRAIFGTDKGKYNLFDTSDLRQIAEHLLVYCNHNLERQED